MINEWEQEVDIFDGVDPAWGGTAVDTPAPKPPKPAVQVLESGAADDPIVDTTPPPPTAPVFTEKKKKTEKERGLEVIEERWTKRLDQAAAKRDAVDQDANPQLWEWENQIWAQDQMQYVNEWNQIAGDTANFEWEKNAKAILEGVTADYMSKYGMTHPQTAPADTGDWDTGEPEAVGRDLIDPIIKRNIFDSSKAQGAPPEKEEMIRTAITGPKKGRIEGLKMRTTTSEGEPLGLPMTIERAAELRAEQSGELNTDIEAAQEQIAELDTQIAEAREAGRQERVDDLVNDRHQLQGQLDPMLETQRKFEAAFRQGTLEEQPGRQVETRLGPTAGRGWGSEYQRELHGREDVEAPFYAPHIGVAADIGDVGLELAGGEDLDPTFAEQTEAARQGLITTAGTGRTTGRKFAPVLPAEIVLGREAGGVTVYRHTDTGEEVRINPDDFTEAGNEQQLADLKAGKLERVGFEKAEKPGTSYTDVDEKVVLASVRVLHRLNQLNARIKRLKGTDDAGKGIIEQEQARLKELQEGRRLARFGYEQSDEWARIGETKPEALHEAAPGTIRDIQDLQSELVSLDDLAERLSQIHTVTLGGYDPTQAQMEEYIGTFKDEPLPGSVGASKTAKEKLRAMREQE